MTCCGSSLQRCACLGLVVVGTCWRRLNGGLGCTAGSRGMTCRVSESVYCVVDVVTETNAVRVAPPCSAVLLLLGLRAGAGQGAWRVCDCVCDCMCVNGVRMLGVVVAQAAVCPGPLHVGQPREQAGTCTQAGRWAPPPPRRAPVGSVFVCVKNEAKAARVCVCVCVRAARHPSALHLPPDSRPYLPAAVHPARRLQSFTNNDVAQYREGEQQQQPVRRGREREGEGGSEGGREGGRQGSGWRGWEVKRRRGVQLSGACRGVVSPGALAWVMLPHLHLDYPRTHARALPPLC